MQNRVTAAFRARFLALSRSISVCLRRTFTSSTRQLLGVPEPQCPRKWGPTIVCGDLHFDALRQVPDIRLTVEQI